MNIKLTLVFMLLGALSCQNNAKNDSGFEAIFDGKTLNNWEGDSIYWRVENGNLVGEITPETIVEHNTFIIWKGGTPADFELKVDYKITDDGNSGVNYRSERLDTPPYALKGYQADIDGQNNYTGQNYEERKRTTLAYQGQQVIVKPQDNTSSPESIANNIEHNAWKNTEVVSTLGKIDSLKTFIHDNDWNTCHIIARGNKLQHYINGVLMSEVIDEDTVNRASSGFIGMQVHVGPPMKVEFRNILLKEP